MKNPKEEPKDVVLGYKTSLDAQMLDRIEPKQEPTLEQIDQTNPVTRGSTALVYKQETLEEVDENKKNLYYYKQVMNPYPVEEYSHTAYEKGFIEGYQESTKWQQERMYSEEDLRNAFDSAREFNSLDGIVDVHIVLPMGGDMSDLQPLHFTFEEWFEQFKKK